MKPLRDLFKMFFVLTVLISCSKGSSSGNGGTQIAPSNLVVNAIASTDGSGNVSFTATATNAVTYVYEYGNGIIETVATGVVTHRYTIIGNITYTVNVTAKSSSGLSISKSIQVTVNTAGGGGGTPSLVFSDEFNVNGAPDPAKWGYDIGSGSGGWGNNEVQYYTSRPENAIVQGGVLKINAIKENYSGSAYTSARLLSKGKYSFKYGRIEVRAKFPTGVGTWPAAWMLGDNINTVGWPACGEIDIVEHLGRDLNKIYGTLHYPGRSGGNANGNTILVPDATTAFHTYAVEWSALTIKIYVDAQLFHTVSNSTAIPFNQNFFILLNMAMGGNFGGAVDPAFTNATYEIDYIRVYQ
ncbi:MAG: glycoside hydrolase family 16 protein [Chitinophagaceae bacterium]|nr:glycoside hydrolase family 16 protein [Chitinophagaceae bacterium]